MRERMEQMQHQMQDFVQYVQQEVMLRAQINQPKDALGSGAAQRACGDSSDSRSESFKKTIDRFAVLPVSSPRSMAA